MVPQANDSTEVDEIHDIELRGELGKMLSKQSNNSLSQCTTNGSVDKEMPSTHPRKNNRKNRFGIDKGFHYDDEDLEVLDEIGIRNNPSSEDIQGIVNDFHTEVRQMMAVSAVCDQFCPTSSTEAIPVSDICNEMLKPLLAPDCDSIAFRLPYELLQQYDISRLTKNNGLFQNVLLSPRSVLEHRRDCRRTDSCNSCDCIRRLVICKTWGCLSSLLKSNHPKFAIANGKYFGHLPPQLSNLTYGTACLLRPVQSYGRLVEFCGQSNVLFGSRLIGHM